MKNYSKIVSGTMNWGVWGKNLNTKEMTKLIENCFEIGVNCFDHADIYGGYTTEFSFGKSFNESQISRENVKFITKCGIQYICEKSNYKVKHYEYSKKHIIDSIEKSLKNKVVCKSIRTTGVPESILQEKITDIINANNEKCDIAFLPHRMLGVDIRLTSSDNQLVEDLINEIVPRIKKYVYGYDNDKLEQVIADLLIKNNLTVSTAESCTSGLLASRLTDVPGSSRYFKGGSVCYSNELKINDIGIDKDLIERYGAVSEEVAKSLAKNIAQKNNTDLGIGITGIAGPDGGTEKKPVGLVFVGIFYKNNLYIKKYNLTPDRITNRELTVTLCLNEIRKILRNS